MSASKFLQLLEQSGMLEKSLITELRKQVAESKFKVSAESVAKLLVDKGHLTKFQATKFVGQATEEEEATERTKTSRTSPAQPAVPKAQPPEEEELGLAPEDAAELGISPSGPATKGGRPAGLDASGPSDADDDDVVLLEDAESAAEEDDGLMPVEDAGADLVPVGPAAPVLTPLVESPRVELETVRSPFDDATGLDALQPAAGGHPVLPPVPRRPKPRWDTRLMWGGSLALALLVIFGGVLYFSLTKTPPLEMFEAAMKDYRAESYSQAVVKFQRFLEKYSKHELASEARVRVVLAQLRLAVSSPDTGLKTAQELIPTIAGEQSFQIAREEFAGILPQIPAGFIKQAKTIDDMAKAQALLDQAQEGMKLVLDPANIPTSVRMRIDATLQRIQEDMALVQRAIDQDTELTAALTSIDQAVAADDTVKAFETYRALVRKFPGLDSNPRLNAAVVRIGQRERNLVKTVAQSVEPQTPADMPSPAEAVLVLARRSSAPAATGDGPTAVVLAGGSVYGLDTLSGRLLWRHHVGMGTRFHPVRLSDQDDADALLIHGQRQELLRCQARDGRIVWRFSVGEPLSNATIAGRFIYTATATGRLLEIDAQTGQSARHAVLPQKLPVAPAVAPNRPRAYQVGEHSSIYVLSTDTLECKDVYYLAHKPGTVDLPPVVHRNFVFVVENAGSGYALLHPLAILSGGDGPELRAAQTPIRLTGNVRVPPVPYGARLLVTTDRGEIRVFDVDLSGNKDPVSDAAKLPPLYSEPVIGYPLAEAANLWMADNRLTNYRVQVTTKEITRNPAIANVGDTFVAPLQLFPTLLVHVRRPKGAAGFVVSGVPIDNPRKPLWEIQVGVPISHLTIDSQQPQIQALTAAAARYSIGDEALRQKYLDQPQETAGVTPQAFTRAVEWSGGRVALLDPTDARQWVKYDPGAGGSLSVVKAESLDGRATCPPASFRQGILLPTEEGDIRLLDPATGASQAMPFQPKLTPGDKVSWQVPAIGGPDDAEFVAVDSRQSIYRVALKDQPQPFLAAVATAQLEWEIAAPLASVGQTVYGVARTDTSDVVLAINKEDLKVLEQWDLQGGRVTWGPERVGDAVLLAVNGNSLRGYDAGNKPRWEQPSAAYAQPAGRPLQLGDDFIFAGVDGSVWRVAGRTGQASPKIEAGEPLCSGPTAYGDRLLVCGVDGTLLVLPIPGGA